MNQSSTALDRGTTACSTRKVSSISLRRPCQSGTRVSLMIRSARSNAPAARARIWSAWIWAITWSVMYMKATKAIVAGNMRKRYSLRKRRSTARYGLSLRRRRDTPADARS